jgi:hypothetical protein
MSTKRSFFSDEAAYRKWVQSIPGILYVKAAGGDTFHEELAQDIDGPYFVAPGSEWLILRVGFPYRVVRRVQSAREADFTWYVAHTGEEGEKVYASYLWDKRNSPPKIVGGDTLRAARGALDEYLSSLPRVRTAKRLWPGKGGTEKVTRILTEADGTDGGRNQAT